MSHFTKISVQIKDKEALRGAVAKMGFTLLENDKARYYYGSEKADLVIKLPGKYDIALNENAGNYDVKADFFNGQVSKYVGENADLLIQQYSVEKVKIEAYKNGLAVTQKQEGDTIIVTLTDSETGGQIQVKCFMGGKTEVKTSGFPGKTCMKFKNIEEALGNTENMTPTMEMYMTEKTDIHEHINSIIL